MSFTSGSTPAKTKYYIRYQTYLWLELALIFMCTYQVDRDKQAETQAFFANMTEEQIVGEYPDGVTQITRWHDVPNGNGWVVVETDNQEALTSWIMSWSDSVIFPVVTPVVDDNTARKLVRAKLASQTSWNEFLQ